MLMGQCRIMDVEMKRPNNNELICLALILASTNLFSIARGFFFGIEKPL